jgi:hypothetical protein
VITIFVQNQSDIYSGMRLEAPILARGCEQSFAVGIGFSRALRRKSEVLATKSAAGPERL